MGEGGWENRSKGTGKGGVNGWRGGGGVEERAHRRARDDGMREGKAGRRWGGGGWGGVEETGLNSGEPDLERKGR
jgi:hypothetical protein